MDGESRGMGCLVYVVQHITVQLARLEQSRTESASGCMSKSEDLRFLL